MCAKDKKPKPTKQTKPKQNQATNRKPGGRENDCNEQAIGLYLTCYELGVKL